MATCFCPSRAEDFIPLLMTETPDHRILRPSRRRQKLRIIPELPTPKSLIGDSNAAAIPLPRSHDKRFGDAIGDGHLNGDRFPEDRIPAKAQRCESGIDRLILQQTTLDFARKYKEKDEEIARMGSLISDSNAAAIPPPRSHHKRFRDAMGDGHLNGDRFPEDRIPAKAHRCESEMDLLILQHATLDFARKLKEKDEEIARMGKVNRLLQEKVETLAMENRIWWGLARDNEAEADSLRSKLVRALTRGGGVDDAESSCGSNDLGAAGEEGSDAAAESRPACT